MTYVKCTFGKQIYYFLVDYTKDASQIQRLFAREFSPRTPAEVVMHMGPTEVVSGDVLTELCVNADSVIRLHFRVQVGVDTQSRPVYEEFLDETVDQEQVLRMRGAELAAELQRFREYREEEEKRREEEAQKATTEAAARGRKGV